MHSVNYDHQDILLHKIVSQIGDGFAIVESFVSECLSIREKKLFFRREGTFFARNPSFLPVRLEAWLSDHIYKVAGSGGQLLQLRPR